MHTALYSRSLSTGTISGQASSCLEAFEATARSKKSCAQFQKYSDPCAPGACGVRSRRKGRQRRKRGREAWTGRDMQEERFDGEPKLKQPPSDFPKSRTPVPQRPDRNEKRQRKGKGQETHRALGENEVRQARQAVTYIRACRKIDQMRWLLNPGV